MLHVLAARCVDLYLEQRHQEAASSDKADIDGRLIAIVERMFERYSCRFVLQVMVPSPAMALSYPSLLACPANVQLAHLHLTQKTVFHACRCFKDGQYEQAVGIALEARRLDKLEQTIKASPDMVKILTYSLQVCQTLVISREFRQQVSLAFVLCLGVHKQPDNQTSMWRHVGVAASHQVV